jgi:hypothetical protein
MRRCTCCAQRITSAIALARPRNLSYPVAQRKDQGGLSLKRFSSSSAFVSHGRTVRAARPLAVRGDRRPDCRLALTWTRWKIPKVAHQLWFATWGQWQGVSNGIGGTVNVTIQMQPLQLAGGIVPAATQLSYQVQIAGAWYQFDAGPNQPNLSTNPALDVGARLPTVRTAAPTAGFRFSRRC